MCGKLILTDCDGVLLNWEYAFDVWMNEQGHHRVRNDHYSINVRYDIDREVGFKCVKDFNRTAAIGFLPPLRDAVYYVEQLHKKHGYVFDVVTSLGTDPYAHYLRDRNLRKVFGSAIRHVTCIPVGECKKGALERYKDSGLWWIEDKPSNAVAGLEVGMSPILVEHEHNMVDVHPDVPIVKNWAEIYEMVTD